MRPAILYFFLSLVLFNTQAQEHSIARRWNEVLLEAIRNDLARPTVHARNLFHHSAMMYDIWAVYDENARTYLLGNTIGDYEVEFDPFEFEGDVDLARAEAISYASLRLLKHRFQFSPGVFDIFPAVDQLFAELGYDPSVTSLDYTSGDPAALGNYVADQVIRFGLQDGSNELGNYANLYYEPVNGGLFPREPGVGEIVDPNRWQPLEFDQFVDQSGNPIDGGKPPFLSAEWGNVVTFAMDSTHAEVYTRDGNEYKVYYDPGPPAYIDTTANNEATQFYRWNHQLVTIWSSHLDPEDDTMIDASPASIGNISTDVFPSTPAAYEDFYNTIEGGDPGLGHTLNPYTNAPYEEQLVKRSDYARVLAEFWADGPDSETPPGHWYTILNYVSDQPQLQKRMQGEGEVLGDLEWDVKAYFLLGGAMHDAAIAAWSVKGYYDYIRPISALRYMASLGQSSDPNLANYHPAGVSLIPGFIEVIETGDSLAGENQEFVGEIKFKAWRGHFYIPDPDTTYAGVGWIRAADWNPYQRQTFVTPPFAGYVSGHSTYSRAAAEVLTALTGDPFFPGGMGVFPALKNEFLLFEDGPTEDVILQWATYRDASDQCSLSRIWGGIHPPIDDIPGRLIGVEVGNLSFNYGISFFDGKQDILSAEPANGSAFLVYPNPVSSVLRVKEQGQKVRIFNMKGQEVDCPQTLTSDEIQINVEGLVNGIYVLKNANNLPIGKFVKN